ncbi:aspartate--tRNA ligase [Candidatus Woesearchaeota archaeon CG10_big_fil_rev_8_21_14_0_10_44_13]|nr:MAG: aspartate--tRNA ligase [Candidatus Woesearchaeota archaeon CG10_big_fil_rev_8_21_14_0_10_44_13]
MKRTHTCGELGKKEDKKEVTLQGWVDVRRDHGGLIFIDLRDRYGITQIVLDPKSKGFEGAEHLRREDCIQVTGKVRLRPQGMANPKMKTGEIEVYISQQLVILNKAETPPIEIDDNKIANEEVRMKYRFLDLRRPTMQQRLVLRHKVSQIVRNYLSSHNFVEVETPLLMKATPEGARDYLVPSRVHPGKFYALPQSPQLYKQLLMVAGMDRYFQMAKCLRDEDLRADRQPEFTQIDVEMSFIEEKDIQDMMEGLIKECFSAIGTNVKLPFPRMSYAEAMDKYGSDKPDIRFGLELVNVADIAKNSNFEVFTKALQSGGQVKCINAKGCASFSRKDIEELTEFVAIYKAKGLAWAKVNEQGKLESSITKFFPEKVQADLMKKMDAKKGDLLLFVADHKHFTVNDALGNLRLKLAEKLNLINKDEFRFIWIVDFPLVEFDEDLQRHVAVHHPFTSPKDEDIGLLDKEPVKVRAKAYDLTLNGVEIGGGSIRIHKRELQEKMFRVLGITKEEAERKFGFLLDAFRYGAPPHGGLAFGFDRLIAIMAKVPGNDIREVIAFPKNKAAEGPMDGCPSDVPPEQLKELNIKSDIPKKEHK